DRRNSEAESEIYSNFQERSTELGERVRHLINERLNENVNVQRFDIRQGSVEVIVTIGAMYHLLSTWKSFVKSIELILEHLKSFFERSAQSVLRRPVFITVRGSWVPGPAVYLLADRRSASHFSIGMTAGVLIAATVFLMSDLFGQATTGQLKSMESRLSTF